MLPRMDSLCPSQTETTINFNCYPAWIRTTIIAFRAQRPTIRRRGNKLRHILPLDDLSCRSLGVGGRGSIL
jgi:hypothetical protein